MTMEQVTPWADDGAGRELQPGDKVRLLTSDPGLQLGWGTVKGFDSIWVDPLTGEAMSERPSVWVQWDDGTDEAWLNDPATLIRMPRMTSDPVTPRGAGPLDQRNDPRTGDVVGVMDNGPAHLQGRAGTVKLSACVPDAHGDIDQDSPVVFYVVCDAAHEGWVGSDALVVMQANYVNGEQLPLTWAG